MIIDSLPNLPSGIQGTDELPIERGTSTYKINYNTLSTAIVSQSTALLNINLGVSDTTWSAIYERISTIPVYGSALFLAQAASTQVLSNNKLTIAIKGMINRAADGVYDIIAYTGFQSQYIWIWRISDFTSASDTPTVGAVYRFTGTEQ